jgi:hypothetical protein
MKGIKVPEYLSHLSKDKILAPLLVTQPVKKLKKAKKLR